MGDAPPKKKSAVVDFAAGTFAGSCQLAVGHPFDTIKTKLQTQPSPPIYNGAFDATRKTLADQGLRGIYRGMGAPLATVALFNAVLFASRGAAERALAHADGSPLTLRDQAAAGAAAGVAVSFVASPTELIKCRLQSQLSARQTAAQFASLPSTAAAARVPWTPAAAVVVPAAAGVGGVAAAAAPLGVVTPPPPPPPRPGALPSYRGPLDVVRHVWATEGGPRGLARGLVPTLAREVPGNAVMMSVYEALKRGFADRQGLASTADLGPGALMVAGGAAGTSFWLAVFPTDVVKSRWQVAAPGTYRSLAHCTAELLREGGVRSLWRGFGPALTRAFPANAACFAAYEAAAKVLGG